MYNYSLYKETCNAVHNANDSISLRTALRSFLCDSAMSWWNGLKENERQAIILLNFDPSVVTTMVFFGQSWGFGGSYSDVLEMILDKADLLLEEKDLSAWDPEIFSMITYARAQAHHQEMARRKAAMVAKELNMKSGISALEDLLVQNSGDVRENIKAKKERAKEMRKHFLSDALRYLERHYNDCVREEAEEEEEGDE